MPRARPLGPERRDGGGGQLSGPAASSTVNVVAPDIEELNMSNR
jgi:hypothetical protein